MLPQKVMLIVNSTGSAAVFRKPLIEVLQNKGCSVCVVTPSGRELDELVDLGVDIEICEISRSGLGVLENVRYILKLVALLKKHQPDAIQTYAHKCNLLGGLAARMLGIGALYLNVTGLGTVFIKREIRYALIRRGIIMAYWYLARHASALLVQNESDTQFIRDIVGASAGRVVHVPGSGIDTEHYRPASGEERARLRTDLMGQQSDEQLLVLICARAVREKGVREFYEAARHISRSWPGRFRFLHVGDDEQPAGLGFEEENLKAAAEAHEVEYLGHRANVLPFIQAADIGCLPSHREGLSRFLLECLACGLPIVTSDAPGCADLVREGENGFVFAVGSVPGLVSSLEKTMEADIPAMGARSREIASEVFRADLVTASVLKLMEFRSP
jgi:N,N'-diacetylbacillosaminyl-diphospho-undecaprenol alpha-1,3-N-acetylgalactosaminyltransferase